MRRTKTTATLTGVIGILVASCSSYALAIPQEPRWHIPPSAMAVAVVHAKDAMLQPAMEMIPREVITVMGRRELGFDPC